ncbi:MAG: radical SAM protein [Methanobacteriota archaeon]
MTKSEHEMNILIIENVSMGTQRYHVFDKLLLTMFSILPTLHSRQLAAVTPKHHTITIINERYTSIPFDTPYDLVMINYTTSTAKRAYEIADHYQNKKTRVVLSGMHASLLPDEAKQHADSVLIGRGETTWPQLIADAEHHQLKLMYTTTKTEYTQSLPPTNIQLPGLIITGAIEATRGCPYTCEFCPEATTTWGTPFTARPVDDVINEIQNLSQKTFMFYDASLTINPTYTKELFTKMRGLHKKFFCNGNVDILAHDEELVRLSKEAGCVSWLIGFESISQQTIDSIKKRTNTVTDYQKAIHNIHTHKMAVVGDFIFGFDTDTPQVFEQTLNAIKELHIDVADFCILTPLPGTLLYERLEKEGRILTKDWTQYTLKHVVYQPKHMTPEQLNIGVKKMYTAFYSPLYTMKRLTKSMRLGIYPFTLLIARNMIALMNARKLSTTNDSRPQ